MVGLLFFRYLVEIVGCMKMKLLLKYEWCRIL